jgi:hypothetical protein
MGGPWGPPLEHTALSLMVESLSPATLVVQQGVRVEDASQNPCDCETDLCAFPCGDRFPQQSSDAAVVSYAKSCVYLCHKLCIAACCGSVGKGGR